MVGAILEYSFKKLLYIPTILSDRLYNVYIQYVYTCLYIFMYCIICLYIFIYVHTWTIFYQGEKNRHRGLAETEAFAHSILQKLA